MNNGLNSVTSLKWDSRGNVKLELLELWLSVNGSTSVDVMRSESSLASNKEE